MANVITLPVSEPLFHSKRDESSFFGWLEGINGVMDVKGVPAGLRIQIDLGRLSNSDLHDLIALHERYGLSMKGLVALETEANSEWFRDRNAYWFSRIFG